MEPGDRLIAAVELGSSKIAGAVGKQTADGNIEILAYAKEDSSSFMKKGVVFNLDKAAVKLGLIVKQLGDSLNGTIKKVYVAGGGQSLHTVKNTIARNLTEETGITEALIDELKDENGNIHLEGMDILDVVPQEYRIGSDFVIEPVGIPTNHIEGNFLNIVARNALKRNLERSFEQANLTIADSYISPIITANAVLTEKELSGGCALVDFGAETTTVSVYKKNILRFLVVIPLGANTITRDIMSLKMEFQEAEELKLKYGDLAYEPADVNDTTQETLTICEINQIIAARTEEIITNVWNQINRAEYKDLLGGMIITGGGANLKGIDEQMMKLKKGDVDISKVRIAYMPTFTVQTTLDVPTEDGTLNTLFGLIKKGEENCLTENKKEEEKPETIAPEPEKDPAKETKDHGKNKKVSRKKDDGFGKKVKGFFGGFFDDESSTM
jgi:cell division protein FtsA